MASGILKGVPIEQAARSGGRTSALRFVQISDSHIGFNRDANPDVAATLRAAIAKIHDLPQAPSFVLHTGDLTHLSKNDEFDTLQQELTGIAAPVFYVPGEHDVLNDNGKTYLERFGRNTKGAGWYSFDQAGVHFIGLVNVLDLKAGGMGILGREQLEWLEEDVKGLTSSTPIVVFAHIPLWSVYPEWGWGTDDSARALSYLKRFGSVAVLNGHIHQVMQKTEGNVTFHTAMSTAFPQPAPGAAPSPGPMKVEAVRLKQVLGLASIAYHAIHHPIAITDVPLERAVEAAGAENQQVVVDHFSLSPAVSTVPAGATVTWTNRDDVPHNIVSGDKKFASPVADTRSAVLISLCRAGNLLLLLFASPEDDRANRGGLNMGSWPLLAFRPLYLLFDVLGRQHSVDLSIGLLGLLGGDEGLAVALFRDPVPTRNSVRVAPVEVISRAE